jgi:cardiolipin synthase
MSRWLPQIPNFVSSLRILLTIPIACSLLQHQFITTLGLFAVAALSDAADGFLAKRFGWQSAAGGILDPAADKLLLATVFITLAVLRLVPLWLMAAAVARDIVIVLGAVAYRAYVGPVPARPTVVSKLNTLSQIALILAIIGREQFGEPSTWIITGLGALTFATVAVSGLDYVLRYGRSAWVDAKSRRAAFRAGGSKLT